MNAIENIIFVLACPKASVFTKVIEMKNYDFQCGTAANAAVGTLRKSQPTGNLAKDTSILYDLVDLEKIFKVTKRTLFNWRAKGIISLIDFGGRLYMTHAMLVAHIEARGGMV